MTRATLALTLTLMGFNTMAQDFPHPVYPLRTFPTLPLSPITDLNWVTFMPSGISVNAATGEIKIPEGLPLSDAAKVFWNGVALVRGMPPPFPELAP